MLNVQRNVETLKPRHQGLNPAMEEALASLQLEDITLSDETVADLVFFSEGKLSEEEAIQRALTRVKIQSA